MPLIVAGISVFSAVTVEVSASAVQGRLATLTPPQWQLVTTTVAVVFAARIAMDWRDGRRAHRAIEQLSAHRRELLELSWHAGRGAGWSSADAARWRLNQRRIYDLKEEVRLSSRTVEAEAIDTLPAPGLGTTLARQAPTANPTMESEFSGASPAPISRTAARLSRFLTVIALCVSAAYLAAAGAHYVSAVHVFRTAPGGVPVLLSLVVPGQSSGPRGNASATAIAALNATVEPTLVARAATVVARATKAEFLATETPPQVAWSVQATAAPPPYTDGDAGGAPAPPPMVGGGPGDIPIPGACQGIQERIPEAEFTRAMEQPYTVTGWLEPDDPSQPGGPDNPPRIWLSLRDPRAAFDLVENPIVFVAECPPP